MTCEHSFNNEPCEKCQQEHFVSIVGGTARADRLLQILKNSYPSAGVSRDDMFRAKALREGYNRRQANTLLNLQ